MNNTVLEYRSKYREMTAPKAVIENKETPKDKEPEELDVLVEGGGYIELLVNDENFMDGVAALGQAWERWKNGPATEKSDIKPAKKDILDYIAKQLK